MITNIEEIRENAPIVDLIKTYVPDLERKGSNHIGCCPFHTEKSPSFTVSKSKGIFTCFGCGESGDAVHFLMEHKSMTFPEALEEAARAANVTVQYEDIVKSDEQKQKERELRELKETLYITNKLVIDEYQKQLFEKFPVQHDDIVDLWGRTYKKDLLEKFQIGFAPSGNFVLKNQKKNNWDLEKLNSVGYTGHGEKGDYDYFRNRLIFPIFSSNKKIVGVSARTQKPIKTGPKKNPKYINTAENVIFKKGKHLFGLSQNRKAIVNADKANVVEGYTDVLTMTQFNFENTVGTMGTALTNDQSVLIKKYCSTIRFIYDNDENNAGYKATIKNVTKAIEHGLKTEVIKLPNKKSDPDSFIRKEGSKKFEELLLTAVDGLYWLIDLDFDKKSEAKMAASLHLAARLLSYVKDTVLRSMYIKGFTKAKYFGASFKKDLESSIQEYTNERIKPGKNYGGLDVQQEKDNRLYGIFVKHNGRGSIFMRKQNKREVPLTNFVIIPVYHINDINNPCKVITLINEYGHTKTVEIPTKLFFRKTEFQEKIGEFNNYIFEPECRPADFQRIMRKVIEEVEECFRISTLGYHPKGFYVWNNGISQLDGSFQESTQNGLVTHDEINYILPGKQVKNDNDDSYDSDKSKNIHLELFEYKKSKVSRNEWMTLFLKVYLDNGLLGIAFYYSLLYRDYIYNLNSYFPHLNMFGPPERGKSSMARSLSSMFGKPRAPLDLGDFTSPGFNRRAKQVANGFMWVDEFKNTLDDWKHFKLKGSYDGQGKEMAADYKTDTNSTRNDSVKSGVGVSGEDLPTKHISLLTRCMTLLFEYERTEEGDKLFQQLKEMEEPGQLSGITGEMMKYRKTIIEKYQTNFDKVRSSIISKLKTKASSRTINNFCIPLNVADIINSVDPFPKYKGKSYIEALTNFIAMAIDRQTNYIKKQDEVGDFWQVFRYLVASKNNSEKLYHDEDIIVSEHNKLTIYHQDANVKEKKTFTTRKKVLFVRFDRTFPLYEKYKTSRSQTPKTLPSLQRYLEMSNAYIGYVKSKRFENNKMVRSCLAFDLDMLDNFFSLPLTKEIKDSYSSDVCGVCASPKAECNCLDEVETDGAEVLEELPF